MIKERWNHLAGNRNHLSGNVVKPPKKVSLIPKKWKFGPKKKVFPQIHLNIDFLQKTASKLVKFGLCSSISDLQTPIWGHHPMLYFPSQIQRNIVLCYANSQLAYIDIVITWWWIATNLWHRFSFTSIHVIAMLLETSL